MTRNASHGPTTGAARAAALALMCLGVIASVSGCSVPPEQPDLNTYGAVQPLCILGCRITFTLSEGDGATGSLTSSVSETETKQVTP